jgi:quercetin dioxygenase-like cupin family protein
MIRKLEKGTIELHPKGWGHELWLANTELYCGKILELWEDKECSIHYHKIKHETFYVYEGKMLVRVWEEPFEAEDLADVPVSEFVMLEGERLIVPPNTPHQFRGLAKFTEFIEFSTQHFEEDSYRIVKGD